MILIVKNLPIPDSLQLSMIPGRPGQVRRLTHQRRIEIIRNQAYIDLEVYNSRYRYPDVKEALTEIYKSKCAFCEQIVEQSHVEHYRPKSTYYWLAFSWDNLLLSCPACNQNKGDSFDIVTPIRITFVDSPLNIHNIHNLSRGYDELEQPLLVNPEVTDSSECLVFDMNGNVSSEDNRFTHTINKCKLNREHLQDARRKILDIFRQDIQSILTNAENPDIQYRQIKDAILNKFKRDSDDPELEYLAFRRYALRHFLKHIIKEEVPT